MNFAAASRSLSPSRLVRALMRRFDGDRDGLRQRRVSADEPRKSFALEALEPRLLLSADLFFDMGAGDNDITVRLADVAGVPTVQIVDNTDSSVLLGQPAVDVSSVTIAGSTFADRVVVDLASQLVAPVSWQPAAGDGINVDNIVVITPDTPTSNVVARAEPLPGFIDRVTITGEYFPQALTFTDLDRLLVVAGGGDDHLTFSGLLSDMPALDVEGGGGNDIFFLDTTSPLPGFVFAGGDGEDTIVFSTVFSELTLTDEALKPTSSQGSPLSSIERAVIHAPALDSSTFTGLVSFIAGVPDWIEQGPGALTGGQTRITPDNPVVGAIHEVLVRPADLASLYVGTVGGGVWKNSDISVLFEFDSAALTPNADMRLAAFADFLRANPTLPVTITGHTDDSGDQDTVNQPLSESRAAAVKARLVSLGIDAARLSASGLGETTPVAANNNDANKALNRRVELVVNHWVPLTDQFPSLSISALAISPRDNLGALVDGATPTEALVLMAGTGAVSNGGRLRANAGTPAAIGLMESSDGGATWTLNRQFAGSTIHAIKFLPNGNVVVATDAKNADGNGLFLRLAGTSDFVAVGAPFPSAPVSDLALEPGSPLRAYAGVVGQGVFITEDGGTTWSPVNTGIVNPASATRIVLSVSPVIDPSTGKRPVYAATIGQTSLTTGASALGSLTLQLPANTVVESRDTIDLSGAENDGVDNDNLNGIDDAAEGAIIERWIVSLVGPIVGGNRSVTLVAANADGIDNDQDGTADNLGELAAPGQGHFRAWGAGATVTINPDFIVSRLSGVFRSDTHGASWTAMSLPGTDEPRAGFDDPATPGDESTNTSSFIGVNHGAQGGNNLSIVADSVDPDVVYIGGDRQPLRSSPNAVGGIDFTGRLYRGDVGVASPNTWQAITDNGANNTAPHADSRAMVFRGLHILEVDDGGLYELRNADSATRTWQSLNGDLALTEFYSVAFESNFNLIFGGTQDIGTGIQSDTGSQTWNTLASGDGTIVAVDGRNLYYAAPKLGGFRVATPLLAPAVVGDPFVTVAGGSPFRVNDQIVLAGRFKTITAITQSALGSDQLVLQGGVTIAMPLHAMVEFRPPLTVTNPPAPTQTAIRETQFVNPFVTNPVVPGNVLIGTNFVYESTNNGRTVTQLSTSSGGSAVGMVTPMVYGGREPDGLGGFVNRGDIVYVGTKPTAGTTTPVAPDDEPLWVRRAGTGILGALTPIASYKAEGGSAVVDIAVDANDWRKVFVLDAKGRIWFSPNSGSSAAFDANGDPVAVGATNVWKELTRDLKSLPGTKLLQSLAVSTVSGKTVVLAGGQGGAFRSIDGGAWHEFGGGLPNALTTSLEILRDLDNLVLAGTFGRGAWTIPDAAQVLGVTGSMLLRGTAGDDVFVLERNVGEPWLLDVFQFLDGESQPDEPSFSVPYLSLASIDIDLLGGADLVVIDPAAGALAAVPINIDGGAGSDVLQLKAPTDPNAVSFDPGIVTFAFGEGTHIATFADVFGDKMTQIVTWTGVENATEGSVVPIDVDVDASGLEMLAEAFTDGLMNALEDKNIAGLDARSLAAALNGALVASLRPSDEPLVSASRIPGSEQIQIDNAKSVLVRIFEAGGLDLASIGTDGAIADPTALELALENLDGDLDNNSAQLIALPGGYYEYEVTVAGVALDGVVDLAVLGDVELSGLLEVTMTLDLSLAFGVDASGFFIRTNDPLKSQLKITDLAISGEVAGIGNVGFLGVDVESASLTLGAGVELVITLTDPGTGAAADSLIRAPELISPDEPADLFSFAAVSGADASPDLVLDAKLGVSALLPGLDSAISLASANVKLTWTNIADPLTLSLAAGANAGGADFAEYMRFLTVEAEQIIDRLTDLQDNLDALFGVEIPYLSDTLTEVVDFIDAFEDKVIDPLTGGVGGNFEIPTIQALIRNLATSLGVSPAQLGLGYDKLTKELTYHLVVTETIDGLERTLGAGVDLAGGLADLEFSSKAMVSAGLTLDAILGLDFDEFALDPLDPRDWFFLRNVSAKLSADISATDIEASARFGFLAIGVDEGTLTDASGVGPANVSLTVSLLDPGTGAGQPDGRVMLGELLDNLANPSKLIDVSGGGSLQLVLPVETSFLPGLPDIPDGGSVDPTKTITVVMPDLSDPSGFSVTLGTGLTELGNFANIDAASIVGVLGQLTYWLDQFRRSDAFANLDIPLVGPALDEALQLADAFRDLVLIDDKDNQLDDAKTLLFDLNAALADAGLGRKLYATNVGGKIGLVALDAAFGPFTIASAQPLGFGASQLSSLAAGEFFAKAVASAAFADGGVDPEPAVEGQLGADLSFTVSTGSGATLKTYTVELAKSATDANTRIGDDQWKLVNAQNAPTFATAQQMAKRLLDAFGVSYPGLNYDAATDSLNFTLDLTQVFANLNLPFSFDAGNLPDFIKLQTSGALALKVSGGLNLEVGVFLGNAEPSDKLQGTTLLAELSEPVVIDSNQRYTAQPVVGKLTADAHFSVAVDGAVAVDVTVTKANAAANTTLADLVADINTAIAATTLNGKLVAQAMPAPAGQAAPQQVQLVGLTVVSSLAVTVAVGDPAATEIGLPTSKTVNGANPTLVAAKTVAPLKGRLTGPAGFTVELTKNSTVTPIVVALTVAQTQDNDYPFSIISDIQTQLDPNENRVKVSFSNGALTFSTVDGSAIAVSAVIGTATNELGIVAGAGNSDDLLIKLRNGTSHRVAFDSSDTTVQDIIDAIHTATTVGGSPRVTVAINGEGSGLTLSDTTTGSSNFKVELLNNATAGLLLGIVRPDTSDPASDPPDGIIEGADIAALTALDRFFVKSTESGDPLAGLSIEIGTPVPLTASATFGFVALGLQGNGGLIGAAVTPANNTLQANLELRLLQPSGSTDGRVSLAEMIDALDNVGGVGSLFDMSLTGAGKLDLSLTPATIASLSGLGIDVAAIPGGPRIEIAADMSANVFDGNAPIFTVTPVGFAELGGFGNLEFNFQSIVAGLAALVDFLDDFEALSFLNEPIPVIDVSVKDLVSIAQQFADAVTAAQNDPAGSLQVLEAKLKAAFGLPANSTALDLVLVDGPGASKILKIDTQLTTGFSKSLPLNLDLNVGPLELGGDADLLAQGSLRLDLDFGFDIQNPLDIYVFNTTGIVAAINLAATDLDFKAAVGPLGVFITNGSASVNGTLSGAGLPANTVLTAGFQGAFGPSGMSTIGDLDLGVDLSIVVGGELDVELPVYFPTESVKAGTVLLAGNLSYSGGTFSAGLVPSALDANDQPVALADLFTFDAANLSLLDQLLLGVDGIDLFLEGLQDLLDDQIGGFSLPLVGDKLAGAADAIGDFRDDFVEGFRRAIEDLSNPGAAFAAAGFSTGGVASGRDPVSKLLFELLGPTGLGVLDNINAIEFLTNVNQSGVAADAVFFDWKIHMADTLVNVGGGIGFDLGIPGIGLETDGEINLTVDWALDLGFGLNLSDGFYLNIADDSELELTARVTTPGLEVKGTLGFLQIRAEENVESLEGADAEPERGETGLVVQFGIDLYNKQVAGDQKLGFAELGRLGIDAKIAGRALADLAMSLELSSALVGEGGNFPSVVADFAFDWGIGSVDNTATPANEFVGVSLSTLKGGFLSNGLKYVGFDDIGLDLGKYFSDVIGPIVETIADITAPIKPFLDFLTEPIPVISDLAGPTSLLDIAAMSGVINPGIIKAIEIIDQVIDISHQLDSAGANKVLYVDAILPGGALTIFDANPVAGAEGFLNFDPSKPFDVDKLKGFVDLLPDELGFLGDALGAATDVLSKAVSSMRPGGGVSGGFALPIIEDPSQIFGMLLGQPADLVTFTMAPLVLDAEFSAFFSIFGPLGVSINAEFAAQFGPFKFGYDTYGITQFAAGDFSNPLLLFDGLYVSDLDIDGKGIDVPELQFDAGLWAAAELNLGIARGGVGGGLFAEIDMNLYDPDDDGRVRIKEIINTISNEIKYGTPALSPLSIFDISGKLTAELFAFLKIDFGFFEVDEKFQITEPIELLKFDNVFERWPTLANELGNGVLQLNIGKNAASRIEGDLTDVGETIYVQQLNATQVEVWAPQFGVSYGERQKYDATSAIIAFGGDGDDRIYFSGASGGAGGGGFAVTSDVKLEIHGDAGNDIIVGTAGNGAALLVGGSGDDNLTGGGGADTLFGGTGIDTLAGKGGNDWLFGDGNDEESIQTATVRVNGVDIAGFVITAAVKASDAGDNLDGGADHDLLFGSGGTDTIQGGSGDDVLIGDGGQATVGTDRRVVTTRALDNDLLTTDSGGLELAVTNTSKNGKGALDHLFGGDDNDHLYGGFGNDDLHGGGHDDVLYGEHGTDTLFGDGGNDVVFGDFGRFVAVKVGAVTTLEPDIVVGGEKDFLWGGDADDKLLGGAGHDEMHGEGGHDMLWGGTGQDLLWGDGGNDQLFGESDSDKMYGGIGDDYLEGGGSNDLALGGAGVDTLVAGYGSDTVDGEEHGDTYRISVRGGSTTELTTAYDTGLTGVDSLIVVGTPGADTLLLRAMADSYFPTLEKLNGLIDRYFKSTLPDRLAGMIQSFNDAYGPWDQPPGLLDALTATYQSGLSVALHGVVNNNSNRTGDANEPTKDALNALIDEVLASDAASKIDAMQKAIKSAYANANYGAGVALPNTLFSSLTAAYRPALNYANEVQVQGFIDGLAAAIAPYYVAESLYPRKLGLDTIVDQVFADYPGKPGLQAIVDQVYAVYPAKGDLQDIVDDVYGDALVEAADRLETIRSRVAFVYGAFAAQSTVILDALQVAWDALPSGSTEPEEATALKDAIEDAYDADAAVAATARFDAITSRIDAAYSPVFATQRSHMHDALQAAWDDLLAEQPPPSPSAETTALKAAISDIYDDDAEVVAAIRFDAIKSRIEAAYADRRSIDSSLPDDEYVPQRTAMLDALQAAWDGLPDGASDASSIAALKGAINADYTADPIDPIADTFAFHNTALVAVINDGGKDVERFNYRRMEGLVVSTLGGADYVVFDDLLAAATINLGDGNDRVQVGQVFRSERVKDFVGEPAITGINAEDVFTTVEITRGWLSNGVSVPTTINGGDGDDNFTVFRNVAVLNLNGGDGDDVFTVRAFALKGSSDNERARTDMKGDGGADTILYVVNAPVGIDGGDGFDTVRIVGTEFGDDFVVTDSGVFGAGLNVSYVNVERLVADGAEGDDRFFVQSTGVEVVTEIDGGLGSDSFFVGGNPARAPVAVVSNDLRGHSGIILHRVESSDTAWAGLAVEGLSANVGDNEEAMILLAESGGRSMVVEGATGTMIGVKDTYTLRLSRAPVGGKKVVIAVVPAGLSPEEQAKNYADLEVWDPDYINPTTLAHVPSWQATRTIELDGSNWASGVEVEFRAKQDVGYEGRRFTFINHKITEATTDLSFLEAQTRSLKVQMEDDDRDGVIIIPSGLGNTVLENGFTDSFQVVLSRAPTDDVAITLSQAGMPGQVLLNGALAPTLTFTSTDWFTPKTVTVSAANDGTVEGFHTEYIRFDVTSADVDDTKGPFEDGDVVTVNGIDVAAVLDDGKVWLQLDGDIDAPGIQILTPAKPSTFVLLPHRPIAGTVLVRVGEVELFPGSPASPGIPAVPARYSVTGNTVTFLSASGAPEYLTGKVEVNYQYKEVGYNGSEVRDQVIDIYDTNTPTVIIQPVGDGMIDVVEGDAASSDTYTVRLASAPSQTVEVVIDSVKTRTTWGASAYFENQLLLSGFGADGVGGTLDDETDLQQITLTFTALNWDDEQIVTVRAATDISAGADAEHIDGNDTQVFAPDLQTVNKIRGPLIIEGAAGAGSLSLPAPLMMPWELNIRPSDGNVVAFTPAASAAGFETMTVELSDLDGVVAGFKVDDPSFTMAKLVGKTLEMSKGAGTAIVLDASRPDDKFDRFWLISHVLEIPDDGIGSTPRLVTLTLQNPTAVDPTQANVTAPDASSEYAITSLSINFFADERDQIDYLFVYDNDSVADDVGALTSSDGSVLAFSSSPLKMTVQTSALQRTAKLLGLADLQLLEDLELTITVGPGTGRVFTIDDVSDIEGETKELTLASVSGSGIPTNRSEFRIEGSDRYGRITGFGMGPNILFAGRPQGGGITYGDIEVVQVELGLGDDTVRVDYATNAEDHDTKRTGDYYTLTILNTGGGDDHVTVALDDGDSTDAVDRSAGDGAFALDTGAGDDTVLGAASTRALVVFGGGGEDDITTGSGDDIVFGDHGRVDYTKKIDVGGTAYDAVVTRLGSSVPQNPVNPHVTLATDTTLTDSAILGTNYEFPTDDGGMVGLSVQVISPEGHVQFRTVIANTSDTITVDAPWAEFPVFDAVDPNDNYYYRVSSYPDDQTDGLFRGARVIWSVKNTIGEDDEIAAGAGVDIVIGGAADDTIDAGGDADYVAGDDARFDFVPVIGSTSGATRLFSIIDPGTDGDDILLGGAEVDLLIGGLGSDNISGEGNADVLIGDDATVLFGLDGVSIISITTTNRENGGNDTIDGGADDDIVIGGTGADNLDGGSGDDLVFGDNVSLDLSNGPGAAIKPRFSSLSGTAIYDANGNPQLGSPQNRPGGNPAWGDWTIMLDQALTTSHYGDDYIAGGAGNDQIFGQRGNDTIQGDGSIASKVDGNAATLAVSAQRPAGDVLAVVPSFEAGTDGDDYIEGNSGADLIFGNLGQDDLIGGSSTLFSLTDKAKRDDAEDLIFGGAGTDLARNNVGDTSNGRDADMILGDNGNIYRLVGAGAYLSFNYDNGYAVQLVPRAAQLIDYTPGGPDYSALANTDIGAADELHGESGDDFIYGMAGSDLLFGEGQDDDLIGGYGNDWISGGTGNDGVIGDDGRIVTSRNGTLDALSGVTSALALDAVVKTGGSVQSAVINVTGQLKKAVNLTPFSQDISWNPAADEFGGLTKGHSDDIIFGGLGDDFLHGGSGDDAISGAEALAVSYAPSVFVNGLPTNRVQIDYDHPYNPGNVLAYNPVDANGKSSNVSRAGEFYLYNEYDPLRKIMLGSNGLATTWVAGGAVTGGDYFLNFSAAEGPAATQDATKKSDGDDKIFGDLGNDWLVGGSGRDNIYGGFGNDLLNANDDLTSFSSLNNQPITSASYEDRAFGGAGRDVLIANTGGDRLIDWTGEFNSYLVPFSPFGNSTVSRTLQPALPEFLYALSASDGADPTRASDAGSDPARNGEPWGELGLVLQKDVAWRDQHGGPADPQPGNIGGTQRDVLRTATFDNGMAAGFNQQAGTGKVAGNRYEIAPSGTGVWGSDAIGLFDQADTAIPVYFEMQATINAVKASAGTKANAYLIFDWVSDTNFKFAGINISTNKLEIGHRNANGWVIDNSTNVQVKAGNDYVILLKANGMTGTAIIGNASVAFTWAARTDARGVVEKLNAGIVGIGGNNAKAQIDNVVVRKAPEPITVDITADFSGASPAGRLFNTAKPATGIWTTIDGRFVATAANANAAAINLASLGAHDITPGSQIDISTTLRTSGLGGVVFDYQGPNYYKFAVLSDDANQIVIGHRTPQDGWVTDATYALNVASGTDYKLGVQLRGGVVNVSINGAILVSKIYAETVTMGGYGLISLMGSTSGMTSFDAVRMMTDEGAYAPATPLLQAGAASNDAASFEAPSAAELAATLAQAKARWVASGLDAAAAARLDAVTVQWADLPGSELGQEVSGALFIDADAAGHGWFVDPTPSGDSEFAGDDSGAHGRYDLLSVIVHEIGHALGLGHAEAGVMAATLQPGARVTPVAASAAPAAAALQEIAAPVSIDWSARVSAEVARPAGASASLSAPPAAEWRQRFVNDLGRSPEAANPNAAMRVFVPVSSSANVVVKPRMSSF